MSFMHRKTTFERDMTSRLNFLWRDDQRPVYIMDNHLGALWCWLRELAINDEYSLMHIDYHWDASDDLAGPGVAQRIDAAAQNGIEHYLALRGMSGLRPIELVRWDNYLIPLTHARKGARCGHVTAHQCESLSATLGFQDEQRYLTVDFFRHLDAILENSPGRLLVNFDLDYFFAAIGERKPMQAFTDDFVAALVAHINRTRSDAIWTIAWSPECCAGWESAAVLCELVCGALGVECPAKQLRAQGFP